MNFFEVKEIFELKRNSTFELDGITSVEVYSCGTVGNIKIYDIVIAQLIFRPASVEIFSCKKDFAPVFYPLTENIKILYFDNIVPEEILTMLSNYNPEDNTNAVGSV